MRRITIYLFTVALGLLVSNTLSAADIIPDACTLDQVFDVESGDVFYDDGGPAADYADCPSPNPSTVPNSTYLLQADNAVQITFTLYAINGTFDWIKFYNGTDNTGALLYDGQDNGGSCSTFDLADFIDANGSASILAPSGNLFIEWRSSTVVPCDGWEATVTVLEDIEPCVLDCPPDITVSTSETTCSAEDVSIPNPTMSGDCAGLAIIIDEDFSGGLPAGWTNENLGGLSNAFWMFGIAGGGSIDGSPMAFFDDDAFAISSGEIVQLTTSEYDISTYPAVNLSFDYVMNSINTSDFFRVEAWDGSAWNILLQQDDDTPNFGAWTGAVNFEQNIDYGNSDFKLRFTYDDGNAWAWWAGFDNLQATAPAADPVINNDYNGGTEIVNESFPLGTTTITFTTFDANGLPVTCETNVTVEDQTPPEIYCPGDQTITLDAGECYYGYNYSVTAFDNCSGTEMALNQTGCQDISPTTSLSCTGGTSSYWRAYNLPALGFTGDLPIVSVTIALGPNAFNTTYQVTTHLVNSIELDDPATTFTEIYTQAVPTVGGTGTIFEGPYNTIVPAGSTFAIQVQQPGSFQTGACIGSAAEAELADSYYSSITCGTFPPVDYTEFVASIGGGAALEFLHPVFWITVQAPVEPSQVSGPPSGEQLGIGEYTFEWEVTDGSGNSTSCTWTLVVEGYPFPISELACNDQVNVSLDNNCEATITADMILEGGPYSCYEDYVVSLETQGGVSVPTTLNGNYVGMTLLATVTDPSTGNNCWGYLTVEDKTIPALECQTYEIDCAYDPEPGSTIAGPFTFTEEPGITILDPGVTTYEFEVSSLVSSIEDMNVFIDLNHTFVNDLIFELTSPSGTLARLFSQPLCAGDDIIVTFDDEATATYADFEAMCNATPPAIEGTFQPETLLSIFDGENPNGTWTVTITDVFGLDGGTLNILSLEIDGPAGVEFPVPDNTTITASGDNSYVVEGFDPCGDVTLSYEDVVSDFGCVGDYAARIDRNWTAVDPSGNVATCTDVFNVTRASVNDLTLPPDYDDLDLEALECGGNWDLNGNGYPDVDETGGPSGLCSNIWYGYEDQVITICGGSFKILRNWTILDECTGEMATHTQKIKVEDTVGPVIECAESYTVDVAPNTCYGVFSVPPPNVYDLCSEDVSYTVTSSAGTVEWYGGTSYVITDLPVGGPYTITYTANDGCGNESTCESELIVDDNVPPVAICDVNTRVSLGSDGIALIHAETFDDGSYDNCGVIADLQVRRKVFGDCAFPLRQNDRTWKDAEEFCCEDVDDNPILIEMRAIDASGNINTCWVSVEVEDKLPPYAQPPQDVTVSCDFPFDIWGLDIFGHVVRPQYGETREVHTIDDPSGLGVTEILDGYATDNCLVIVEERDPRLDLECGQGTITRLWTIYDMDDENGNGQYEEDGDPVTIAQRITIVDFEPFFICDRLSREKPFDDINRCNKPLPHTNYDDVEWPADIRLDECPTDVLSLDPEHLAESTLRNEVTRQPVSLDAYPTVNDDNCSQIAVLYDDEVFTVVPDACFKILRHWSIIDWCQYNVNTGEGRWEWTQVIKVLDEEPPVFVACEDVTFCDTAAVGCTGFAPLAPELMECTPAEYLDWEYRIYAFEDAQEPFFCNNHVDLDVDINDITNRVTVTRAGVINSPILTDDIVYSTDNGGTWQPYFVPFVIDNREDLLIRRTVSYDDGCATDVTTYGRSGDASRYYPFGTHRIQWRVEDMCGNVETCDMNFTVEDCKKPTPVCINGLSSVVMPINRQVTIWASDFDASSFDNCDESLDFRIWHPNMDSAGYADQSVDWERPDASSTGDDVLNYLPSGMVITCDDLTNGISETFIVEVYAIDNYGNWDYCTTYVIIDDNDDVCPDPGNDTSVVIAGAILNEIEEGVSEVDVRLVGGFGNQTDITEQNNELGLFAFSYLPMNYNWQISSARNDDHLNGVTTYDLALIQRHILGLENLNSPYKLIAADANDDATINILDIVDIRKLILGIYDEFPSNQSWRFVDKDATFEPGMIQPPADYPEMISYYNVNVDMRNTDFTGVKIGDVDGSAIPNNLIGADNRNFAQSLIFTIEDQAVVEGQEVAVEVKSSNFEEVIGYQFTLGFDNSVLEYTGVEAGALNVSDANFGTYMLDRGLITTSWNDSKGVTVAEDDVLFTMTFTARTNAQIGDLFNVNSARTVAEAYSTQVKTLNVAMQVITETGVVNADAFALYQNTPNPFADATIIGFNLPEATEATLTVYDLTGKVMKVITADYVKGYNEVSINRSELSSAGVLYYQLDTDDYTATKKMIVVE